MKWMIASDIHGSAFYCKKMIESFKNEKANKLILLGDILYHGPRNDLPKEYNPKEVIELLNNLHKSIICVRGNCDSEVDQMVLFFPIFADYALLSSGKRLIFLTHGHKFNENNLPSLNNGDILINGHTHVPECIQHDNYIYMNPGSISIPKENSEHSYMIFEKDLFIWKDLDGNEYKRFKIDK